MPAHLATTLLSLLCLVPNAATAAPKASGRASLSTEGASAEGDTSGERPKKEKDRGHQKWIKRWAPERNMLEIGVFGGAMFPHPRLELYEFDDSLANFGFQSQRAFAPEFGGRFAYYPAKFLGLEVEGAGLPTQTEGGQAALMYAARGHVIAQLARWSVTPFLLAGPSGLGVSSDRSALGNDIDLGFHFGGGLKFFFNRWTALRLDVRDTLTARRGVADGVVHSPEVLLGFSITLLRKKAEPKPEPSDRDKDGILDKDDACPDEPGVPEYEGCPIPDTDGDGIPDPDDECVDEPGVPEYEGCPIPDTDGDGILDPDDECVDEPGVPEYKGCPIPDTDGDGIFDDKDACIEEPETVNQFEDTDGCPDQVPETVKEFTGVIEGIFFDSNKAKIKPKSTPKLDKVVKVLEEYESLRLEISGHTDSRGNDDYNRDLSQRRADAVKQYLVDHGIDAGRLQTRGAGEDAPLDTNKTKKGRAKNRRIEFELLD